MTTVAPAHACAADDGSCTTTTARTLLGAPDWWEQKLFDPIERPGNQLGWSVALEGDTVMFGAMQTMIDGDEGRGAVHVYQRDNGTWRFAQTLTSPDGDAGDAFGSAIAIHDGVAVISSSERTLNGNWGAGAVYVYVEDESGWTYTQTLVAPGTPFQHKFGVALALDDTTLAVASHTSNQVYLHERDGAGDWQLVHTLTPAAGVTSGQFGLSVAVDGDRIAVGAPTTDEGGNQLHGSVWMFERVGGIWQPGEKLLPGDFDPANVYSAYFGQNVALQGDTVLVGARLGRSDGIPDSPGAAYVFEHDDTLGAWVETQKIGAVRYGGQFGNWVALDGNRAVISAPYEMVGVNGWQGRAYVYERGSNNLWALVDELVASDGMAEAQFGFSLDLDGDTVAIGAVRDRGYRGAGYMYQQADGYTVTPSVPGGGGSITPATPQEVMQGTTVDFTLTPATGHVIGSVGGSCGGSLNGPVFTTAPVTADCTVEADFAPEMLTVTATVEAGAGSISPQGAVPVAYGDSLTLTLTPAAGHVVETVGGSCGGNLAGGSYVTDPVVADCTASVRFGPDPGDRIFADGFEAEQ